MALFKSSVHVISRGFVRKHCCSASTALRNKLKGAFRATLKGRIMDLHPLDHSQAGHAKRVFDLVDSQGFYITCCAMKHNVDSMALVEMQEVVAYYGTGRGPIGSSRGMFYLLKDSMFVPSGAPSLLNAPKQELIECA